MSTRQTKKVAVGDLLRGGRRANFGHCCRGYDVRPEFVLQACSAKQQKSIGGCFGLPGPTGHDYWPAPSARRLTSSTDSVGAPGRRANTGIPRSNRTSAFAIRLSSPSTNSSTGTPDWLARSASRCFKAASTVIVAFGIGTLSHDEVRSANRGCGLPSHPTRPPRYPPSGLPVGPSRVRNS